MDCFTQVCFIISIFSKQPQGTEVQSIFSAWKPKIGHRLIVSLVNSDIFIGFFATSPEKTRKPGILGGEVVTAKVPKKTRKKKRQLFKA